MQEILAGSVDQTIDIVIQDTSLTDGGGLQGLVYNASGLTCYYRKGATGSATQLNLATQTVGGAHSDGGFVEVSAANMPGLYRLDLSDTMVDTAGQLKITLKGAANMAQVTKEICIKDPPYLRGSVNDAGAAVGDFDGVSTLSATNDYYNGAVLAFTSGVLKGISRKISDYVGASKNFQFNGTGNDADAPFPTAPANGDTFVIIGRIGT